MWFSITQQHIDYLVSKLVEHAKRILLIAVTGHLALHRAGNVDVVDLNVADRRLQRATPIDQTIGTIDQSFIEKLHQIS
jgi:hypothetical protein